jgi:BlaI family penicillinase repressor
MSLTNQELQIMRIVWQRGDTTVRDVYEEMRKRRRIAYTTVMTMMNVLERKGRLMKRKSGRAFCYAPVSSRDQVLQEMLIEFVDRVFEGSVPALRRAISTGRKGR